MTSFEKELEDCLYELIEQWTDDYISLNPLRNKKIRVKYTEDVAKAKKAIISLHQAEITKVRKEIYNKMAVDIVDASIAALKQLKGDK